MVGCAGGVTAPSCSRPRSSSWSNEFGTHGVAGPLAYFHPRWRRDAAPLLDELGASVDHVEAHALGGSSEINNLATICAKCNVRKGEFAAEEHQRRNPVKKVKGKHGEPLHWDGLAGLFIVLAAKHSETITLTDKRWLAALSETQKVLKNDFFSAGDSIISLDWQVRTISVPLLPRLDRRRARSSPCVPWLDPGAMLHHGRRLGARGL
jgi:hypothetical protein